MTDAEPKHPERKHPAHWPVQEHGNRAVIVHLVLCTQDRRRILAHPDIHALLKTAWSLAPEWRVGRYVIMPDHVHLFCGPGQLADLNPKRWATKWKAEASRHWPRPNEHPIWQRDCWDRQLRAGESYHAKWQYVCQNPVRHGLVTEPNEWPHQGEINVLEWHD